MNITRIDDFVSGIRPIEKDLSNFFKVFDLFEANEIEFHLGIVPALLEYVSKEDKERLLKYKYLIPVQHGYEHRYKEFSALLIQKGDVHNKNTMGVFNEFENVTYEKQLSDIQTGNVLLKVFFNKEIDSYIPVCNYVDDRLIMALNKLRFKNVFLVSSNVHHNTKNIKKITTKFNGRLLDITDKTVDSICLHITWENDAIKEHGWDKWEQHFYAIFPRKVKAKPTNHIPHIANFYWNTETPLSYLRYLTIVTFRMFHPNWTINIWVSGSDRLNVWNGVTEKQDFQIKHPIGKNYLLDTLEHGANILQFIDPICKSLAPNYVSDIARFKTLFNGGWFFDLDQIFTRNLDELCDNDFVTGIGYVNRINCGVLGATKESTLPQKINEAQITKLNNSTTLQGYCELGNHFLHDYMWGKQFNEKILLSPSSYFYPISTSPEVDQLYTGKTKIDELKNNWSVHWYGGHPKSQEFNIMYSEVFSKTSKDSISVYCRKIGAIK